MKKSSTVIIKTSKKHDLGYYLQRHNSDIDDMSFMFFEYKIDSIINLIYLIILFVSIFIANFKVSLIMIIIVPIFILANKKLIPKIEVKTKAFINSEEDLNSEFEASFNNSHAIRALRIQDGIFKEYLNKNRIGQKAMLNYSLSDERYNTFIVSGLLNLCNCLVYIFGAYLALKGEISIGQLTTVNIFVSRIWDPVEYFLGLKKRINKAKISEKRVFDLLNKETIHLKQTETASFSEICFSNINFGFKEKTLFDNFRLDFKTSSVYLIGGKNGSGKTTLFNILSGLYFDDTHKIEVDGKPIDDKANFLYNNVYYIPSENYIFKGTIKDNLKSFDVCPIENHSLDDDVSSLSSGETKKLQLLQSINRKEKIIIYDEPLNYLDKSKYQDFYDIVNTNKDAGHIILIASHEKIKDVDYISIDI